MGTRKKTVKKVTLKAAIKAKVKGVNFEFGKTYDCTIQPFGGYTILGAFLAEDEFKSLFKFIQNKKKVKKEQTFRVYAKVITYCYLDVPAKSQDEAEEIAQDTDGGDFVTEEIEDGGDFIVCPEEKPTHEI